MSDVRFTKGTWHKAHGADGVIVTLVVSEDAPYSGVATICKVIDHDGSAEADGDLISAAQDMYFAAENLLDVIAFLPGIETERRAMIAALKKAEGQR